MIQSSVCGTIVVTQAIKENNMELGMIGLGRMGINMVRRLLRAGHQCVVYNHQPEVVQVLVKKGDA